MIDPVAWACALTALVVLAVFGVLEQDAWIDRLGGGFRGKCVAKALGGGLFLGAAGVASVLLGLSATDAGVGLPRPAVGAGWTAACLVVFLPIVALSARRPASWAFAPELRADAYPPGRLAALVGAWAAYLFGYELWFRGVLTFVLVRELGDVRGIAVMTALYALAHLTKRPSEAFATLLVGPLWAWIALQAGGFWPVFVAHLATALTSEITAAVANPAIPVGRDAPRAGARPEP